MYSNMYMISFGIVEIIFSQISGFDQLWRLSIVAAVISFTYSTIGLGLGIGKVIGMNSCYSHVHHDDICSSSITGKKSDLN